MDSRGRSVPSPGAVGVLCTRSPLGNACTAPHIVMFSEEVNEEERKTDEPTPPSPGMGMFPVDYGREGPDSFGICIWV